MISFNFSSAHPGYECTDDLVTPGDSADECPAISPTYQLRKRRMKIILADKKIEKKKNKKGEKRKNSNWYKNKIKNSTHKDLNTYREKQRAQSAQYRKNITPEKRQMLNEKAKLRMRVYRKRWALREVKVTEPKVLTREEREAEAADMAAKRERWRLAKRVSRIKQSPESKLKQSEKRKQWYAKTKKRIVFTVKDEPDEFVEKITNLLQSASPSKKKELEKRGIVTRESHSPSTF